MMFKDVLHHMNLGDLVSLGLVIFFVCFLAILFYALTRSPEQTDRWARIPLDVKEDKAHRARRSEHE